MKKSLLLQLLYPARNLHSRYLFRALRQHCKGNVLDVGGWDFFLAATKRGVPFTTWTTLEPSTEEMPEMPDTRHRYVRGNGCHMPFPDNQFDTVLCIQVLEHVFEPIRMVSEIGRVLKPGGHAIFLIPQTGTMHLAPQHYYNFTRFWIMQAMRSSGFTIVEFHPLGGVWSSMASHLLYFFLQSIRSHGMSVRECRRNALFYLLYPAMVAYALVSVPICLILSLGDLTEEANNHLVIVRKV